VAKFGRIPNHLQSGGLILKYFYKLLDFYDETLHISQNSQIIFQNPIKVFPA